jgi:predicted exporter
MSARNTRIIALWLLCVAAACWVVRHAQYVADLSAFLPAKPTPMQTVLVEQLRDGPASRTILIALENGDPATRAEVSQALARRLMRDVEFSSIENGAALNADRDREFLFQHRYLLSDAVTNQRFTSLGLRSALTETIADLSSSTGLLLKSLVPHDPTGEMLRVIDQVTPPQSPRTQDGVWVSPDARRTLLVAQTRAAGSDTDAEERALHSIRTAFDLSVAAVGSRATSVRLRMSGTAVFAVAARAKIKGAAVRLSVISSGLVIGVLLAAYRSIPALFLGLLPVASGALAGIAAVALGFGVVHGITLGFGITLIGEAVDYSIYFFIQSMDRRVAAANPWQTRIWPTLRLGMLTSVCGFASLLPSGFPGLAQLGLYSITGLLAAAMVTRFVLPELLPAAFKIRDVTALGKRLECIRDALRRPGPGAMAAGAAALAAISLVVLHAYRDALWNPELSSLSPVSPQDLRYDATLRADLGAADVLDLVVVSGSSLDGVLAGAERVGMVLGPLVGVAIGGFDNPSSYVPSLATQRARLAALPDPQHLRDNLRSATTGLDVNDDQLSPFLTDVEAARHGAFIDAKDLEGTSLKAGFDALVQHLDGHCSALLPLHALRVPATDTSRMGVTRSETASADGGRSAAVATDAPHIDVVRVRAALAAAALGDAQVLDLKAATDALYEDYLHEAMRLSAAGFALIVVLLCVTLRSAGRVARVLAPLCLAVLVVAAALRSSGQQLTLLHLVGMLLIVAVGSNYALFFDREDNAARSGAPLTLASLAIANLSTVIGFGLLSFSQVPVLVALGSTVGPGAFLALLFSSLLTSRTPPARGSAHVTASHA